MESLWLWLRQDFTVTPQIRGPGRQVMRLQCFRSALEVITDQKGRATLAKIVDLPGGEALHTARTPASLQMT